MIGTILRINWLSLKRDYVALALTFVLPIVFFSIFAVIFGSTFGGGGSGGGQGGTRGLRVVAVDEDQTDISRRFVAALRRQEALSVTTERAGTDTSAAGIPFTAEEARQAVRGGRFAAAVVIPEGWGQTFGRFDTERKSVAVIHDAANPLAAPVVSGLLQAAAMQAAPDALMQQGLSMLETWGGELTPAQRQAVDRFLPFLRGQQEWNALAAEPGDGAPDPQAAVDGTSGITGLVAVELQSAREEPSAADGGRPRRPSAVAYYAAGIGVMFLLFSMAGAGGSLLEEEESGTLERLLTSNVGMGRLLLGDWIFFAALGIAQVTLMFVWGAVVFGLDLWTPQHLAGFVAMTFVTATAAAAFGILLATIARSRAQLSGFSTIIILIMSALGGSMVPRFIMPDFMHTTALFTFNGWALDGYLKVFWYDDPQAGVVATLTALWPQLLALALMAVVFLGAARLLARRWETV